MRVGADARSHEGPVFVTFVCLGGYCGAGMHVAPNADLHDGAFDIVLIGDLGRIDVLVSLRRLFDGTIATHPKVRTWRAAALTIDAPHALAVEADGELIGRTPVTLAVLRAALRVIAA
jgi:diacylglycerol kinase family enzyme